jgi:hypothetical protein
LDYTIKATNSKGLSAQATMSVSVIRNNLPPVWSQNPIQMVGKINKPFDGTLKGLATDAPCFALTFTKEDGPAWLTVNGDGTLSGTPQASDAGTNRFKVKVSNDILGAIADLVIEVKKDGDPVVDTDVVDTAVPGAQAENLWVVDNTWSWGHQNKLIKLLKDEIGTYNEVLNAASIHHTGVYLSSDPSKCGIFKGKPVPSQDGNLLLQWSESDWTSDFVWRVNNAYAKKCNTAPTWAMHKFYQETSAYPFYHQGYFTEKVPMDVLIVTAQADYYKSYSKGTQYANDTPEDYAKRFIEFHKNEKQAYRISAIAPNCAKMLFPIEEEKDAVEGQSKDINPYKTLVAMTKGKYYKWDCNFNMEKVLRDYATDVKLRAYVNAHTRIHLSKTPNDATQIKVFLMGKALDGSLWFYDSAKNDVVINWYMIDLSTLTPGAKVEVKYIGSR